MDTVAGRREGWAGGVEYVAAELSCDQLGEGGLAESGWSEEKRMIKWLPPSECCIDVDAQGFLDPVLADEFGQALWAERELDYALRKNLWAFEGNRIAVRFQYESHDATGQWFRSYGNELWEFDEHGFMRRREASINDLRIEESERSIFGPRPASERDQELPLQ